MANSCKSSLDCMQTNSSARNIPDCLKCLKEKLRAENMAVFSRTLDSWQLDNFEGDLPRKDCEVLFYGLLLQGIPEILSKHPEGIIATGQSQLEELFGSASKILEGNSIVGVNFAYQDYVGLRIAFRDDQEPFTDTELELLSCIGDCPPGCCEGK